MVAMLSLIFFPTLLYIRNQTEFSPTMILHKEIANDCCPSALCDRNGDMHVVWQSDRNGNWDIFYLHSENNLLDEEFVCLTDNQEDDLFPSLAEDEKGNIWVIWIRNGTDGSSICGKTIENQRDMEAENEIFIPSDNSERKSPCLISIDPTRMLLAWISKKNGNQEIEYTLTQGNQIGEKRPICITDNSKKVVLGKAENGKIFVLWDSMHMGENNLYLSFFDENGQYFLKQEMLKSSFKE